MTNATASEHILAYMAEGRKLLAEADPDWGNNYLDSSSIEWDHAVLSAQDALEEAEKQHEFSRQAYNLRLLQIQQDPND